MRRLVHVTDPEFHLLAGSLLDALKGQGPYFVTILNGEYGSAKSSTARLLRSLIDPVQKAPLAAMPKDERDLGCEGHNNHVLAFDNISKLPRWLSDAFCRVATGAGIKTRKLYTDSEQQIFDICRPLLLNGIEDFATAGDLVDRSIQITLQRIDPDKRLDEKRLAQEIEEAAPGILGALLDGLVHGLQTVDGITLDNLPRMADSTKWIAACLPGLGLSFDTWLQAFQESQSHGIETSLESSLTAKALLAWWNTGPGDPWVGTPKELYELLIEHVPLSERRYFPASPKSLSDHLRRDAPALRQKSVIVTTGLRQRVNGEHKRAIQIASADGNRPDEWDARDARDATGRKENPVRPCVKSLVQNGLSASGTHGTQESSILTQQERRDAEAGTGDGLDFGENLRPVRPAVHNLHGDEELRRDAPEKPCVPVRPAASRRIRFWSGTKVMLKAFPDVKGLVMGYLPFKKAYTLLLAGDQFPQALQERLYSPAGMPGQARIEVAAEEIVLCDEEKST